MNILGIKLWEILLVIAVILLGAIAYETHKANASSTGRYVVGVGGGWAFDTHTGETFFTTHQDSADWVIRDKWQKVAPAIP